MRGGKSGSQSPSGLAGTAPRPPRFLVAVNFALKAACLGNPPDLLRYVSSSQKVLRYFSGALLICFVCPFGRALGFGARARSARVTVRRQPHRQLRRRLVYKPSARLTAISVFSHVFRSVFS